MVRQSILLLFLLALLSSCQESEFYEKSYLEGVGVPEDLPVDLDDIPDSVVDEVPGDSDGGNTGTTDNNGGDGDNTGTTDNNGGDGDNTGTTDNNGGGDGDNTGTTDNNGGDGDNTGTTDNNGGDGDNAGTDDPPVVAVCGDKTLTDIEDKFVQNTAVQAKVDILWVIDDSGSMGDEQDSLAKNFDAFIKDFISRGIDFKMAITTTDGRNSPRKRLSGKMRGNPDDLTAAAAAADEQKFMEDFKRYIKVGTRGSGNEVGLQTTRDFFDRNGGWMRDDAFLTVVIVSDEEDHSQGSVGKYVSGYQSLKANSGLVKVYSIVTKELRANKSWETLGKRYIEASELTGGKSADIHKSFHTTLNEFGGNILNLLDSFPLSYDPLEAELKVTVNGVEVSEGWVYNKDARTVKFDRNAIPGEGSIVFTYYKACVGGN